MNIPSIQTVLWDIQPDKINSLSESFVLQRVLSYGSIFLIADMISKKGIDAVRSAFIAMKPTAMSSRRFEYIKNYLLA